MGEVVQFPKSRIIYPERVYKEASPIKKSNEESIKKLQISHVDDSVENLFPIIFRNLLTLGFDLSSSNNIKEGVFIVEAIRSALLQSYNIHHPFQTLSEEVFENVNENTIRIVTKLNIELKPEEDVEEG